LLFGTNANRATFARAFPQVAFDIGVHSPFQTFCTSGRRPALRDQYHDALIARENTRDDTH
jgi:hypothetical protein